MTAGTRAILDEALREHGTLHPLRPPPPITSARDYVRVCRRLRHDIGRASVDGRLVAVGWNHESPSRWVDGRVDAFVDYWRATQRRPDLVGSVYNAAPCDVYAVWRAGVSAPLWQRRGAWYSSAWVAQVRAHPRGDCSGRATPERVRLVLLLAARFVPILRVAHAASARLSVRDLRALARLPGWLLRAAGPAWIEESRPGGWRLRPQWERIAAVQDAITPSRRRVLEAARIPAQLWAHIAETRPALLDALSGEGSREDAEAEGIALVLAGVAEIECETLNKLERARV